MTNEEFENEIISRLVEIRALYKKHCPNAFVEGDDASGYLSLTIFNDAVLFQNGGKKIREKYGIDDISGFKSINNF